MISHVSEVTPNARLSVVGESCPLNYVRTKLRLEELADGQVLEVIVSEGEGARNVPRSASDEGHEILAAGPSGEGTVRILIRKRETRHGA